MKPLLMAAIAMLLVACGQKRPEITSNPAQEQEQFAPYMMRYDGFMIISTAYHEKTRVLVFQSVYNLDAPYREGFGKRLNFRFYVPNPEPDYDDTIYVSPAPIMLPMAAYNSWIESPSAKHHLDNVFNPKGPPAPRN